MCTENCWKMGVGVKGVRESNGRDWTGQSIPTVGIHWEITLNINLNNNNKKQDCKIGTVSVWEEGEWRRLRWWYMADGLHIPTWNRTKTIGLSAAERWLRGRDDGGTVTNVQYKSSQNCH
jgi:hypothetical protein